MKRKPLHLVSSPDIWNLLMSPVRFEVLEALRMLGPCTIAEVATTLDRPADALYRHVEILQQAGAVVEAGFRKGNRNVEQLFDTVADDFQIDFQDSTGKEENRAVVATVTSFAKAMTRTVRDSAAARQLELRPEQRNLSISYELSWLDREAFQKVRELVRQLKKIMDDGKRQRQGRLYMSLVIAAPVTRKRGAGARSAPKGTPDKGKKAPPKK